jgi:protein-S-isoprenylcysteine O-methyltransferase Ste14
MYVAFTAANIGQALLLSRPVLLIYTAALLAALIAFVRLYEERTLVKRFGADYEAYRKQVPGWWPRWPRRSRRTPGDRTGQSDREPAGR